MWGLWSLNERAAGREGIDLPRPTNAYLTDLIAARQIDVKAQEKPDG